MRPRNVLGAALAMALLSAGAIEAQQSTPHDLYQRVSARLVEAEGRLVQLRRDIHQHPEVSGAEERTAGLVAERLRALGFEVRTGVGGHGVIGVLAGGKPGPMVAFRADMDAVPSNAPDPVEFRSLVAGVRHICGHDVHTTVGIGIAEGLAAVRRELAGSVMLVFQPAEERATGARAMLADGAFGTAKPDAIYAVHTAPLPVGQLGTASGGMMAGRDLIRVTVSGTGDLEAAVDSIRRLIQEAGTLSPQVALQSAPPGALLAQVAPPRASGGERWTVRAQITTASDTARMRARETILRGIEQLALPGVQLEPEYEVKAIAGVTNEPALVERANASIRAVLGDASVITVEPASPAFSEDFGSFQEEVPGVMYFLGVSNPTTGTVGMPHSPDYVADEGAILVGARAMTAVMLDWLTPR